MRPANGGLRNTGILGYNVLLKKLVIVVRNNYHFLQEKLFYAVFLNDIFVLDI